MKKERRNKTKVEINKREGEREEQLKCQVRMNVTYSELAISSKYEKADSQGE